MATLKELVTERNLKNFAGASIYKRGLAYYRSDRVRVKYAYQQEAECVVRGTSYYIVNLWLHQGGDLGAMCSCPYAANGWFCKHMVAAGLAIVNYLEVNQENYWQSRLNDLMDGLPKKTIKPSNKYWLFISLQRHTFGWKLQPYHLRINDIPNGVFPDDINELKMQLPELIRHNHWILDKIKIINSSVREADFIYGRDGEVAFTNLLTRHNKVYENQYYYNYQSDPYGTASLLPVMARTNLTLFLGDARNPIRSLIHLEKKAVNLSLDMRRNEEGLELRSVLRNVERSLDLSSSRAQLITGGNNSWVLAGDYVFPLQSGIKLENIFSWFNNPILTIPIEQEDRFFEDFFPKLAEEIQIEGPEIVWEDVRGKPVKRLYLSDELSTESNRSKNELLIHLRYGYGDYEVPYQNSCPELTILRKPDSWTLLRIYRDPEVEQQIRDDVSSAYYGLKRSGKGFDENVLLLRARVDPIDFLMQHVPRLTNSGFEIYGEEKLKSARVNRKKPTLTLNVSSGIDWFDLGAVVKFGDVEADLGDIRKAFRRKDRYIKLADGTIGEIPEKWLQRYQHLFGLSKQTGDGFRMDNHHLAVVDQLLAEADQAVFDPEYLKRKQLLLGFEKITARELPAQFRGELRPYQKAGLDWLYFLHDYNFGGCLADDMGLGKTVETLVFLLSLKESGHTAKPSLLVLPRSLLVNWQREAENFTPGLKLYEYFGNERTKDYKVFHDYDLIFTTYGVMLRDIEMLRNFRFHYVILDESQAIKNPVAKTSKSARLLNSDHRLALTGTPVENSTLELWSQFAFLNPGLLGNLEYFKRAFSNPIEREKNGQASKLLQKMVYPFILRRTKEQVAPELPLRTERVIYMDMEPAQRKLYVKTRDYYRGILLGAIEEQGIHSVRMKVLEGLLRLRQICNHPRLVKENFRGTSSKYELLLETLDTLKLENHKALVFSQFVQMLKILRLELDRRKIAYTYLDGQTRKRQDCVDNFQNDPDIPFFLISLRAGGVGLNLTAADYVIHIDPWWNPAVEMQATDRTHRIGQDKPVFVYKLITRDSVEESVLKLQRQKKDLVDQLITTESSFFKNLTAEDVGVLFS